MGYVRGLISITEPTQMFKRPLYSLLGLCFGQLFATDAFRLEDIGARIINRLEDSQYLRKIYDSLAERPKVPRIEYPVMVFHVGAGNVRGNLLKFYHRIAAIGVEGYIARIEVDSDRWVVHRTYQR